MRDPSEIFFGERTLAEIIERHKKWLRYGECGLIDDMRAAFYAVDLSKVDLSGVNLRGAYLEEVDFTGADLSRADLSGAKLRQATFSSANVSGILLDYADLQDVRGLPYIPMACPDTGAFIGWKMASSGSIVKLLIPEDAKRSSSTGRKCRCDKAIVLSIESYFGDAIGETRSVYDPSFFYRVGELVKAEDFCEDRFQVCAPGIHFYISRQEAVDHR